MNTTPTGTTNFAQGNFTLFAASGVAITDTETYTACTTGTGTYDFQAVAQRIQ